jgi:hypothetical protein
MAGKRRQLTENGLQQGGLATAVGAGQRHAHRAVDTQIQRRRADERQLQLLEHQHLLVRAHFAAGQRQQHRLLLFHPLIGFAHRRIEAVALILMLFAQRAKALLRRRLVGHPLKRGDIQRIDDAQRLRRAPLAHVVLFLLASAGAATLLARMLQIGARRLLFRVALAPVVIVVAAVAAQRTGCQFDNALHARQQLPVMAGDQQPAAPLIQLLIQPGTPDAVEVVGRFVQQQKIRFAQQRAAQRRAHPLTAAQRACGSQRIEGRQPGGDKGVLQTIVEIPAPFQTIDIVRQRLPLLETRQRGEHLTIAQQLGQRGVRGDLRLLRNVSQCGMGFDVPVARPIPPGDQAQQLGFTDAVAPTRPQRCRSKARSSGPNSVSPSANWQVS